MASCVAKFPTNASGYMVRTALYHLLNEGTGTAAVLARLSDCNAENFSQALARMERDGFVAITHYALRVPCSSRFKHYSLTPKGIELALQIDPKSVAFADPEVTSRVQTLGIAHYAPSTSLNSTPETTTEST